MNFDCFGFNFSGAQVHTRVIQSMTSSMNCIVFLNGDDENKKNGLFDFIQIFLSLVFKIIHLNALPFVSFGSIFALKSHKTFLLHSELYVKLNYLVMQGLFKIFILF